MLIRALLVLLVVLNLGVAGWWISRPDAPPSAPPRQPQGVARLQLASEAPAPRAVAVATPGQAVVATEAPSASVGAKPEAAAGTAAAAALQCFSLGPFADAAAANAAIAALPADAARSRTREVKGAAPGNYTVFLPPAENRAAAQALAQRIAAAGFDDFLIVNEGELANGIALGLYRNRIGAERRRSALQAAGFPAQVRAAGEEGPSQWWADIATEQGLDAAQARAQAGAKQSQQLDCAALR